MTFGKHLYRVAILALIFARPVLAEGDYCRSFFKTALNPIGAAWDTGARGLGVLLVKKDPEFDAGRYWTVRRAIEQDPNVAQAAPRVSEPSVEEFFARLDSFIDGVDGPRSAIRPIRRDTYESRKFVKAVREVLSGNTVSESRLDSLTLLFYGLTRESPYDIVDTLFRVPTKGKMKIVRYEMDRLFMKHSIFEVLRRFGIQKTADDPSFWRGIQRGLYIGLNFALKAPGMKDAPIGLTTLAFNAKFFDAFKKKGYQTALEEWGKAYEKKIGKKANLEVVLGISGTVISAYFTYLLADDILRNDPDPVSYALPTEVSEATLATREREMRERMKQSWYRKQVEDFDGEEVPQADVRQMVHYYDTLNLVDLRRRFDAVEFPKKP